jgi:hemoglobin-like flavoprotein
VGRPDQETIEMVRASCAGVIDRPALLAEHFYEHLFELAPQVRDMFPEDMALQNERMSGALLKAVQGAHNPARVEFMLRHMGAGHGRHHNVAPEHYPYVGRALVRAVRDLSPQWAPALGSAWVQVYEWMAAHMVLGAEIGPGSGYEEAPTVVTPEPKGFDTEERTTFELHEPKKYGPEGSRPFPAPEPEPAAPAAVPIEHRTWAPQEPQTLVLEGPKPFAAPASYGPVEPPPFGPVEAPPFERDERRAYEREPRAFERDEPRAFERDAPRALDEPKTFAAPDPTGWWQDSTATAGKSW